MGKKMIVPHMLSKRLIIYKELLVINMRKIPMGEIGNGPKLANYIKSNPEGKEKDGKMILL